MPVTRPTGDNIQDGSITNADVASGAAIDPAKISGVAVTASGAQTITGLKTVQIATNTNAFVFTTSASPTNANTPLRLKSLDNAGYEEVVLETAAALRITNTLPGTTNQFRLLPYQRGIYFQNTDVGGQIYFGGINGTAMTGPIAFQSGVGGAILMGPSDMTAAGKLTVQNTDAASPCFVGRAASGQSTDILQVRDSSNNVLFSLTKFGDLAFKGVWPSSTHTGNDYPVLWLGGSNCSLMGEPGSTYRCAQLTANRVRVSGAWGQADASRNTWVVQLGYESNINGFQVVRSPAGNANAYEYWLKVDNAGGVQAISNANVVALSAQVASGQTADMVQFRNSSGTALSGVAATGEVRTTTSGGAPTTSPPDGSMHVDTSAHRLYVRSGGVWKYTALT